MQSLQRRQAGRRTQRAPQPLIRFLAPRTVLQCKFLIVRQIQFPPLLTTEKSHAWQQTPSEPSKHGWSLTEGVQPRRHAIEAVVEALSLKPRYLAGWVSNTLVQFVAQLPRNKYRRKLSRNKAFNSRGINTCEKGTLRRRGSPASKCSVRFLVLSVRRQSIQSHAASPDIRHLQIPVQQNDVRVGTHAQRAFFELQPQ